MADHIAMKSRLAAGWMGILMGWMGVHKFYIGATKAGVIMLLIWIFGFLGLGIPNIVIFIIGVIEGIIYLRKTDDEFYYIYEVGKKQWF